MHNVRRVPGLVLALVQHRKPVQLVVVAVLRLTTKECFRSRSRVVRAVAMESLLKTHVPRVVARVLNAVLAK
jgi:hypothetical protein